MIYDLIDHAPVDITGGSNITALIDADSIQYVVGWQHRDSDDVDSVIHKVDQFLQDILVAVQATQYAGFFSPSITYRHDEYPAYKATRKDPHPGIAKWKPYIKEHCMNNWKFDLFPKLEADDAVAVLQGSMVNSVICSPDKDLKQIPGNHYDYNKGTRCLISEEEGMYNWAFQMLVGDIGDNIKGIKGMGKVGASKLVNGFMSVDALRDAVVAAYGVDTTNYELHKKLVGMGTYGSLPQLQKSLHTFDIGKAVPNIYLRDTDIQDAEDIFGTW